MIVILSVYESIIMIQWGIFQKYDLKFRIGLESGVFKMESRIKRLKWNSLMGIVFQISSIIVNFILPRFYLQYYGSEVYGLVCSITQFLAFINIADLGISAVVSSALYKPLAQNDEEKISRILAFARRFFYIAGTVLVLYVGALSVFYPQIVKGKFSSLFTITLLWSMSISQFGQFFLGITYQILLNADQKSYIQLTINTITILLNAFATIIIMISGGSIQFVKLTTSGIFLLRPLLLYLYVKRHYNIDYEVRAKSSDVPQKKSGVIQHITYVVYSNTDVAVLTVLSSLSDVSIYSVYILVNNGIKSFVMAISNSFLPMFGNLIAKEENSKLNKVYVIYEWWIHSICTFLFTICAALIVPFVLTYTKGINDANYYAPLFALLLTISCGFNTIREGMYILIKAAGHYKQTQIATIIEAIINISISIILVFNLGIVGVAIGTVSATVFYNTYEMVYLSKHIVYRELKYFLKQLIVDMIFIMLFVFFSRSIVVKDYSYLAWLQTALVYTGIGLVIELIVQSIFYKDNIIVLYRVLKARI